MSVIQSLLDNGKTETLEDLKSSRRSTSPRSKKIITKGGQVENIDLDLNHPSLLNNRQKFKYFHDEGNKKFSKAIVEDAYDEYLSDSLSGKLKLRFLRSKTTPNKKKDELLRNDHKLNFSPSSHKNILKVRKSILEGKSELSR